MSPPSVELECPTLGVPTTMPAVLRGGKNRLDGVEGAANRRSPGAVLELPPRDPCEASREDVGVGTAIGKGRGRSPCGR